MTQRRQASALLVKAIEAPESIIHLTFRFFGSHFSHFENRSHSADTMLSLQLQFMIQLSTGSPKRSTEEGSINVMFARRGKEETYAQFVLMSTSSSKSNIRFCQPEPGPYFISCSSYPHVPSTGVMERLYIILSEQLVKVIAFRDQQLRYCQ